MLKRNWWKALIILTGVCICFNGIRQMGKAADGGMADRVKAAAWEQLTASLFPIFSFVSSGGHESSLPGLLEQCLMEEMPIYAYGRQDEVRVSNQSSLEYERIIREEGGDELHEARNFLPEESLQEALEAENEQQLQQKLTEENTEAEAAFLTHPEKQQEYDSSDLKDEEWVRKNFYAVDSTTEARAGQLNAADFVAADMTVEKGGDAPRILIYHTHSQEGFADSEPGNPDQTVVGVGEHLAQILREEYGYNVLHHTGEYDVERRDYAYSKAAPAVEALLEQYPSIEVIIDLHRDSVPDERKLVVNLDGRDTAMIMFFNGLSYTRQTGPIDYLNNPNLEGNLAFAFQMQLVCNEYYPGLTRKIYIKGYRYNMHYLPKTLLIELGAQTNTLQEALNACDPLAHALSLVLNGDL